MADALTGGARKRFSELAPHQIDSFQARSPTLQYRIAIKEILEHLRSSLEYCAREIHERCTDQVPVRRKIYFPIAPRKLERADFRGIVGKCIPGLLGVRDDLVRLLESFQEFASADNQWLPDFATLSNENKHEQLSIQQIETLTIEVCPEHDGLPVWAFRPVNKCHLRKGFTAGIITDSTSPPPRQLGTRNGLYFRFAAINYQVESFLETAMDGVERIVSEIRAIV
jgi:hypothetical protein